MPVEFEIQSQSSRESEYRVAAAVKYSSTCLLLSVATSEDRRRFLRRLAKKTGRPTEPCRKASQRKGWQWLILCDRHKGEQTGVSESQTKQQSRGRRGATGLGRPNKLRQTSRRIWRNSMAGRIDHWTRAVVDGRRVEEYTTAVELLLHPSNKAKPGYRVANETRPSRISIAFTVVLSCLVQCAVPSPVCGPSTQV